MEVSISMIYILIVFAVAAASVLGGFYRRISRQTPALIGTALGIITARLLGPGFKEMLYGLFPSVHGQLEETFLYDTTSRIIIFAAVYLIFKALTFFVGKALGREEHSILDNIGGALFSLFKYLLFLSMAFNFLAGWDRESALLNFVKSDDGNAIEEVMLLSPALTGGEDVTEYAHKIQMEEARKISY